MLEADVLAGNEPRPGKPVPFADLIHRNVAKEISGLREYLEIPSFRTPGEILAKADRMEVILFSSHDPDFDGIEPPDE